MSVKSPERVWWYAFGYFACYVPYSAITKALSTKSIAGPDRLRGLEIVPGATLTSMVAMFAVITALGWWSYPGRLAVGPLRIPAPNRWTLLGGLATAVIVLTTTLAYTFEGVSIPIVMLLMRGGVLMLAPIVDAIARRPVRWFSWVALALSALSLLDALINGNGFGMPALCALDIVMYLFGYFVRLRLMSRLGKSDDPDTNRRYFVEEQMVATPAAVLFLAFFALLGPASLSDPLRRGFAALFTHRFALWIVLAGVLSQGTGLFGGLVLLDARENTFCVPLNRASSILAGLIASTFLAVRFGQHPPSFWEIVGAVLVVISILVLWAGPRIRSRASGAR